MGTGKVIPIFGTKRDAEGNGVTTRVCAICGNKYVWRKWSRRPGCPRCQPTLFDDAA